MFCCTQGGRLLVRNYTASMHRCQYFSSKVKFFTRILDFPTTNNARSFLRKNDFVMNLKQADVFESFEYLTKIGITIEDIRNHPKILGVKQSTLRNRNEILNECGCVTGNVFFLYKYLSISFEPEMSLKKVGIIDNTVDMQQRLADTLNVELVRCNENEKMSTVRMHILRLFFVQNNVLTSDEFSRILNQHMFVKRKSFRWTKAMLNILTNEFNIPSNKIKDFFYMFRTDPDNLQQLLTIDPIDGVNMMEVMRTVPSVMHTPYETVKYRLAQLKNFGVSGESLRKCFQVLLLDSKELKSRLAEMKTSKELEALNFHPSILKLVTSKFRAQYRVDHLNELDKKCYNMTALTGYCVENFRKFTAKGDDKHLPKDCVSFLAKNLQLDPEVVINQASRHPYWLFIPFVEMKQTIDMVEKAGFHLSDIGSNIHIVLYSGKLVLDRLQTLNETEQIEGHSVADLSKSMKLKLVLYQIEKQFHFTGDGVCLYRKSNLNVE